MLPIQAYVVSFFCATAISDDQMTVTKQKQSNYHDTSTDSESPQSITNWDIFEQEPSNCQEYNERACIESLIYGQAESLIYEQAESNKQSESNTDNYEISATNSDLYQLDYDQKQVSSDQQSHHKQQDQQPSKQYSNQCGQISKQCVQVFNQCGQLLNQIKPITQQQMKQYIFDIIQSHRFYDLTRKTVMHQCIDSCFMENASKANGFQSIDSGFVYTGNGCINSNGEFVQCGNGILVNDRFNVIQFIGAFVNGVKQGNGIIISHYLNYPDFVSYRGQFKQNKFNGWIQELNSDGTTLFEGMFLDSEMHGFGTLYNSNGTIHQQGIYYFNQFKISCSLDTFEMLESQINQSIPSTQF